MNSLKLFILVLILMSLSGCWSKRELNELAIATGMAIDKVDDGYIFTVQLLNSGEVASSNKTTRLAVTTYRTKGETVFEAVRKLTAIVPRKIYSAHVRVLILGEELARAGVSNPLDIISRDHEMRTDFYILVARDRKGSEILNILTPLDNIPANKIFTSLQVSEKAWAPTKAVHLDELISNIVSKEKEAVLTGITISGDAEKGSSLANIENIPSPAILKHTTLAAFIDDKLIGWLNTDESKGYNYLSNNITTTAINVKCENDGLLSLELFKADTKLKGEVVNGQPKMNVDVFLEANIAAVECDIDLTKPDTFTKIEEKLAERKKSLIQASITKAQNELKSDIFGFGEVIHIKNPKAWKKLQDNWNEQFSKMPVEINVEAKIRRTGTTINTFSKEN